MVSSGSIVGWPWGPWVAPVVWPTARPREAWLLPVPHHRWRRPGPTRGRIATASEGCRGHAAPLRWGRRRAIPGRRAVAWRHGRPAHMRRGWPGIEWGWRPHVLCPSVKHHRGKRRHRGSEERRKRAIEGRKRSRNKWRRSAEKDNHRK